MKTYLDFANLDALTQSRMRRIFHPSSASTALRILQSRHLWSSDSSGYASFKDSLRWDVVQADADASQIVLSFEFLGHVMLVPQRFNPENYKKNVLYHHVCDSSDFADPSRIPLTASRLAAGTSLGLKCIGATSSPSFSRLCAGSPGARTIEQSIQSALATARPIRIPRDADERSRLEQLFAPARVEVEINRH